MRTFVLKALSLVALALTAWTLFLHFQYAFSIGATRRHHLESALLILFTICFARLLMLPAAGDHIGGERHRFTWIVGVGAVGLAFALFWPVLTLGFLSDDFVLAGWAARGEFVSGSHTFVRPVPLIVWRALFELGGGAAAVHACSVLLHGVNAALTAHLARRLGVGTLGAAAAGVLFLVWPTQVEAVAWASSMSDVMATTLILATVSMYLRHAPRFTPKAASLVVYCAFLAMLAKETAVALPAILLAVAALRWRQRPPREEVLTLTAVAALAAAYLGWRLFIRPEVPGAIQPSITRYVLKEQISRTFGGLAIPLTTATSPWRDVAFGWIALLTVVWPMVWTRERRRDHLIAVAAALWCLLATAPAVGYLFVGGYLEGSRYLYLPMVGWSIVLAASWDASAAAHRWMRPIGGAALALLIALSAHQSSSRLDAWREAARQRDVLLAKADAAMAREHCGAARFTNLPETVQGAVLFSNGFDEALQAQQPPRRDGRTCELRWDGSDFR